MNPWVALFVPLYGVRHFSLAGRSLCTEAESPCIEGPPRSIGRCPRGALTALGGALTHLRGALTKAEWTAQSPPIACPWPRQGRVKGGEILFPYPARHCSVTPPDARYDASCRVSAGALL